jgi:hypothetical protein
MLRQQRHQSILLDLARIERCWHCRNIALIQTELLVINCFCLNHKQEGSIHRDQQSCDCTCCCGTKRGLNCVPSLGSRRGCQKCCCRKVQRTGAKEGAKPANPKRCESPKLSICIVHEDSWFSALKRRCGRQSSPVTRSQLANKDSIGQRRIAGHF